MSDILCLRPIILKKYCLIIIVKYERQYWQKDAQMNDNLRGKNGF